MSRNKAIYLRYLQLQGLCVPSVKTTTYVCNRFNTSLCAREHKTNQAISNLNRKIWNKSTLIWVGFLGVLFYPFAPTRIIVWKTIPSFEFLHLVCTTSSTDLRFNKKFEQEKKSLNKTISKSIYVDTSFFIICNNSNWMWCLVTYNKIFFLNSQKSGGIASVIYWEVKNEVTYWNTIILDRNQIHTASNFLLLSS